MIIKPNTKGLIFWISLFLFPVQHAWAKEKTATEDPANDYLAQMTKIYWIDPETVDDAEWFITIASVVLTLLCVALLCYLIVSVLLKVARSREGAEDIRDPVYWKRFAVALFLLLATMSGLGWAILMRIYDGTLFFSNGG